METSGDRGNLDRVAYTLIELEEGLLSFHVEGEIDQARWRDMVAAGICWLKAQGGGKLLLPHALA